MQIIKIDVQDGRGEIEVAVADYFEVQRLLRYIADAAAALDSSDFRIEYSDWQCHLLGSKGDGISWRPLKGQEPNAFWRWMQYLAFGNRWERTK